MNTVLRSTVFAFWLSLYLPVSAQAYYSPEQGRWLNRDPLSEIGPELAIRETVAGLSRAGKAIKAGSQASTEISILVHNNPLNAVDFLGLATVGCTEVCRAAVKLGLVGANDVGGVICYDGIKCPCVWQAGGLSRPTNPNAAFGVLTCTMLHEDTHLPDTECPLKAKCEWGNIVDRFPGDWYSRADSECKSYRAQRSCLYRAANMLCGDDLECWQQLLAEIDKVSDRVKDWCRPDYPQTRRRSL